VTTALGGGNDFGRSVAIQSDGKILLAGQNPVDFALVRYGNSGTLDNSFGSGGIVITDLGTSEDVAYSVALQSDDKVVIGGSVASTSSYDFALARYNSVETGLAQDHMFRTVMIYPNPTKGVLTVTWNASELCKGLALLDASGRKVIHRNVSSHGALQVDMMDFSKGVYLVELQCDNGLYHRVVIKE
jgi:uncharacterized delta-60 repeat protein